MSDVPTQQALNRAVRDVVEFVHAEGWDAPPTLCALVPTHLVQEALDEDSLDDAPLAAVVQQLPENLPAGSPELGDYVSRVVWPDAVVGCVLAQEIQFVDSSNPQAGPAPARLFTGVLASGEQLSLLQLRPTPEQLEEWGPFAEDRVELRGGEGVRTPFPAALLASFGTTAAEDEDED